MGTGATVTYVVASQNSDAHGTENCRRTTGIAGLLQRSHITEQEFHHSLSEALRMWSDVADVRFAPAVAGEQADIVIAAEADPDGVAYSDVTPLSEPSSTIAPMSRAVVCLNPQVPWTATRSQYQNSYRLFYVLAHEIGHTIGLDHPNPSGTLMSFEYNRSLQALQPGDRAGAITLYGTAHGAVLASHAAMH